MSSPRKGLTLIESLVAVFIVGLLTAVMLPALSKARRPARVARDMGNQRNVVSALHQFAAEHDGRFPPSVARIRRHNGMSWDEPLALIGYVDVKPYRATSAYLKPYVDDPKVMYCPNTPKDYPYLHEAWAAGDGWRYPDPVSPYYNVLVPHYGSYVNYWGYTGYLDAQRLFRGPTGIERRRGESSLLISDLLVYDNWRSPEAFVSSEPIYRADPLPRHALSCDYWYSLEADESELEFLRAQLNAGYSDGHVETCTAVQTVPMRVINHPVELTPFKDDPATMGRFYIPAQAIR